VLLQCLHSLCTRVLSNGLPVKHIHHLLPTSYSRDVVSFPDPYPFALAEKEQLVTASAVSGIYDSIQSARKMLNRMAQYSLVPRHKQPRRGSLAMVAQECTPTSRPQRVRSASAVFPQRVRSASAVFPQRVRNASAVFPQRVSCILRCLPIRIPMQYSMQYNYKGLA